MRLAIEKEPSNKRWTNFHVSEPVPTVGLCRDDKSFKAKFMAIKGVKDVHSWDYKVSIERAACFTWDELTPKVVEVLREHFGVEKFETVEPYS